MKPGVGAQACLGDSLRVSASICSMRILVVSNLYPPVVRGGYEVECQGVVDYLRQSHDVVVLTSSYDKKNVVPEPHVIRSLAFLEQGTLSTLRTPLASLAQIRVVRTVLRDYQPEFIWIWNGAGIPQTALRVLAESGTPLGFRVCEHWFSRVFAYDRFTGYLYANVEGWRDRTWQVAMRAFNRMSRLRYDPNTQVRCAISWNSDAIRRMAPAPPAIYPLLERVTHSTSRKLPLLEGTLRNPDPEPLVLFLGRRDVPKGADIAVRAIGELRRSHGRSVRMLLAGPPALRDPGLISRVATEAGVSDLIEELGPQDANGVSILLSRAHILVIPSTWAEPYPLVSLEGAAAGVPLVASSAGGIPEFIRDGVEGLLFEPEDVAGLAAALQRVFIEPAAALDRVHAARERARDHDWPSYLEASEQFVWDAVAALRGPNT